MLKTCLLCGLSLLASFILPAFEFDASLERDECQAQFEDLRGLNFPPLDDFTEVPTDVLFFIPDVPADESGLLRAQMPRSGPAPVKLPPPPDAAQIQLWMTHLYDDDAELRVAAEQGLLAGGEHVIPALKAELETNPELEAAARIQHLLDALDGFGPEEQGLAVKITASKTYLKTSEPAVFRIQYHNRSDFPLVVHLGATQYAREFVLIQGDQESQLRPRLIRRTGRRVNRHPNHRFDYVEIPAHGYQEESVELSFIPRDTIDEYYDDKISKVLPTLGRHTIALRMPVCEEFNPNHLLRDYTHILKGDFKSDAEIWRGKARSNTVELTLWNDKSE